MAKQSFLKGALILLFANIFVKFLGFTYQVFLIRLIGPEGIGIFNLIFPLYITTLVLTTAGLPLAVSKFVAAEISRGNHRQAEIILRTALTLLFILATIITFFAILAAPTIIKSLYTDPRGLPALLFLLPTLPLVSLASVLKGFFQGLQDMRPTALSQLIEQIIRISIGLLLIFFLRPYGLTWTAVGLALAVFLSELGGLIYLLQLYKKKISPHFFYKPSWNLLKKLFSFGIPITITRLASSVMLALESNLIPRQLKKAGRTLSAATSFYGELSGVALTILAIPSTLTFSLATTLLPAISEAESKREKQLLSQRTSEALGITLIAGIPAGLILFFWGPLITKLLFRVTEAGELLQVLALGSIFLYLLQTTTGILQGLGYVQTIMGTTLIGGLIRISGILWGGNNPLNGPFYIALSYVGSYIFVSLLNLTIIRRKTLIKLQPNFFLRLIFAGTLLSFILNYSHNFAAQNVIFLIFMTFSSALLFFLFLFLSGDHYSRLLFAHLFRKLKKGAP